MSIDQLPTEHPLNFGAPGGMAPLSANRILYRADRVLFLGARLDLGTTAFQRHDFGAQAQRVMIDIDFRRTGQVRRHGGYARRPRGPEGPAGRRRGDARPVQRHGGRLAGLVRKRAGPNTPPTSASG